MTDPRTLPSILIERADDFIKTMKFFIDEQRSPRFIALKIQERYVSPDHPVYAVSARFIVPTGERGDVPVMIVYELPPIPDGDQYFEKIRKACWEWKIHMVPGLMSQNEPDAVTAQPVPPEQRA